MLFAIGNRFQVVAPQPPFRAAPQPADQCFSSIETTILAARRALAAERSIICKLSMFSLD